MKNRDGKKRGYPLPDEVEGHDLICVTLMWPNERRYRDALRSHLYYLGKWTSWERVEDSRPVDIARYVTGLLHDTLGLGECEDMACTPQFRTLDCLLQWKPCPEDDWETIADLSSCAVPFLIRDTGNGQLQTSSGGGIWGDVPNAHYLHILSDNDPLLGGLAIHPLTDAQTVFVARHAAAIPTQSLFRFEGVAGSPIFELNYDRMLDFYGNSNRIRLDRGGFDIIFNRATTNFITVDDGSGSATPTEILALRNRATVALAIHALGKVTVGNAVARNAAFYATNNVPANPTGVFRAASGQSGDMFQIRDSADAVIDRVFANGAMEFGVNDALTAAAATALYAYHHTTGTPAAGFGTSFRLLGDSTTTQKTPMGRIDAIWTDPTNATRKAEMVLLAYDTDSREFLRGGADGSEPTIAVLGEDPIPRWDLGDLNCMGNGALLNFLNAMKAFGWIDGTFLLGDIPDPDPDTTVSNNGVAVPSPLPSPDEQECENLCQASEVLGIVWGSLTAYLIDAVSAAPDKYVFMASSISDAYCSLSGGVLSLQHFTRLENLSIWHDLFNTAGLNTTSLGTFIISPEYLDAIFSTLVTFESLDAAALTAIAGAIAALGGDYAAAVSGAISCVIPAIWQRYYYIGLFGESASCECEEPPPPHDWCVHYPFADNNYWVIYTPLTWGDGGVHVPGSGWQLTNNDAPSNEQNKIRLRKQFSSMASIVQMRMRVNVVSVGSPVPPPDTSIVVFRGGSTDQTQTVNHTSGVMDYVFDALSTNDLNVQMFWRNDSSEVYITDIWLYGDFTEPTNTDGEACE